MAGPTTPTTGDSAVDAGWLVYGVTRADLPVPRDLVGVDDQEVRLVRYGGIAAVVGRIALDRPPGRRRELLAYAAVLDRLAALGPIAPVRFGSILADEREIEEDLLAPREDAFAELLDNLAGRVQMNLGVRYLEDVVLAEIVAAEPEVARLRALTRDLPQDSAVAQRIQLGELVANALEARRAMDADAILADVERLVVDLSERAPRGSDHVLDVALLVDEQERPRLEQLLEDWAEAAHDRMRMQLVGPVAPYDFVGAI